MSRKKVFLMKILIFLVVFFLSICAGFTVRIAEESIESKPEPKLPKPDFFVMNHYQFEAYCKMLRAALKDQPLEYIYVLREEARERTNDLLWQGQTIYGLPYKPISNITWERIDGTAGTAYANTFSLKLNEILYVHNVDTFLNEIIPHEVAHLIHSQKYNDDGNKFHSESFKEIMKDLVGFSTKDHRMDLRTVCDFLYELLRAEAKTHSCDMCTLKLRMPFCPKEMIANVRMQKIIVGVVNF